MGLKGIEQVGRIEPLIILPVASFHLPVVAWGKGADEFVADPVEFQMFLEQGRLFVARGKTVGKLCAIISLNAFDWTREGLYQMFYKLGHSLLILRLITGSGINRKTTISYF